ncbi:hypothetical protein COCC4DRAFT_62274 [Bipolaris maydis ATCC 48331]|uniref:Pyruvate decarboxylase n=2 Tax=Cochliobolus heterostrophus TaxID=5016 RepID=M2UT75_COCH5|nr:uncharacterized protein COCC4DRAFT_62274 [Bipolaris maydis ATCC 48331]EMD96776.1 hypothetical protein COCHEDRAFT_1150461 [Bipolaris maydis C5]KAJ5060609.1 acetolactate synthase [Bipolaris maydis]ENI03643.1 hypothetical protein COCC4DRAFT_62274 [Bipolaris maydis ATCC 48331]KAJ6201566.1 acetolactate synthase [Bipolaris maydis]KAJ6211418.1 acetolactate synthase [Bipolaris maydis]
MVALSMADGYARLSGEAQCVIVHVDVGTLALAAAVHNAAMGRAPVLTFAGLSLYTIEGKTPYSRTYFIHWIQDVLDQKQIVAQYFRYVGEIKTGKNLKQIVRRALQLATSHPQGPSYLMGAREVMEENIEPYSINSAVWRPIAPAALLQEAVREIAEALVNASDPPVIVGFTGRCSDMCFPAEHPGWLGMKYGVDAAIENADVFLILDWDVPWINKLCKPKSSAKVFHLDVEHQYKLLQWIHCGGGGLGWSGGGALGIKLAADAADALVPGKLKRFVVQIVGDRSYMFSVPSSVYWISARYRIPVLAIVLNNLGWNAPRRSMLLVHPDGPASRATKEELNISFAPSPDYVGIARAASNGEIFGAHIVNGSEFEAALNGAVERLE